MQQCLEIRVTFALLQMKKRVSDITIGDYWRAESAIKNCSLKSSDGVSCIIINPKIGKSFLKEYGDA